MKLQMVKIDAMMCLVLVLLVALFGCDSQKSQLKKPLDQVQQASTDFWDPVIECSSTTIPEKVQDEYWFSQFERVNGEVAQAQGSQLLFFGDSITLNWSLLNANGSKVWQERFAKYQPLNMGNSGDITPVMLYRATRGNLDFPEGQAPRVAVVLCGTNNYAVTQSAGGKEQWHLGIDTPPNEVADGVRAIAQVFRRKLPSTRVILLGILPVKQPSKWAKCQETNRILEGYHFPQDEVVFLDLKTHFMDADGTLKADLYTDGTHLTPKGYEVLGDLLGPEIERLVGLGPIETTD